MAYDLSCSDCGAKFRAGRPDKCYCSQQCAGRAGRRRRGEQTDETKSGRNCQTCGNHFRITPPSTNRRYCSDKCAREAAKKSRAEFHKRNANYNKIMWHRHKHKDPRSVKGKGAVERLRRRFPDLPSGCEICGEERVLDIAHKPEFSRDGMWRSSRNTLRHMFWILCPTCHALLDRGISTAHELGLRETLL